MEKNYKIHLIFLLLLPFFVVKAPLFSQNFEKNSSKKSLIQELETSTKYKPLYFYTTFAGLLQENKGNIINFLEEFARKTDNIYAFLNTTNLLYLHYNKKPCSFAELKNFSNTLENVYNKFKNRGGKNNTEWIEILPLKASIYALEPLKDYNKAEKDYQEYLKEATNYKRYDAILFYYTEIAEKVYKKLGNYQKVAEFNLKALYLLDSLKKTNYAHIEKKVISQAQVSVCASLATLNYEVKNFHQAIIYWKNILDISTKETVSKRELTRINSDIGISYRQIKDTVNAFKYLYTALEHAKESKDTIWIGIIKGNLGDVWMDKQAYKQAIPLLEEDVKISLKYEEVRNAIASLIQLGNCYIILKNYPTADKYYLQALDLYKKNETFFKSFLGINRYITEIKLYKGFVELYTATAQFEKVHVYQMQANMLQDSLNVVQVQEKVSLMQSLYNFDKKDVQNKLLEKDINNQKLISWIVFLSALGGFILLAFWLILYRIRLKNSKEKRKAEKEISQLKQQQFEENIALREKEITEIKLLVTQKTNVLEKLETELALITQHNEEGRLQAQKIVNVIKNELNLGNDISKFKNYVDNTHATFFIQLSKQYPTLSLMDLRMCSYIRANMQNKQIAEVMNIKYDSLRVNKLRLRKKMSVETEKELYVLLQEIKVKDEVN